ncbi:hypothetical protein ACFQZ4_37350 [Catellatospora coxensis]
MSHRPALCGHAVSRAGEWRHSPLPPRQSRACYWPPSRGTQPHQGAAKRCSSTVASFLQRLGRTGRRPGSTRNCLFLAVDTGSLVEAAALLLLWGRTG